MSDPLQDQGRIVVGVDGSPRSAAALRWALRQAVLTGAQVEAVACWHRPAIIGDYAPGGGDMTEARGDATWAVIAGAVALTDGAADVPVAARVVEGYAAQVLVEVAVGADLLVVGSRRHGELSGVARGSVALDCASRAPCPVLIVRNHEQLAGG